LPGLIDDRSAQASRGRLLRRDDDGLEHERAVSGFNDGLIGIEIEHEPVGSPGLRVQPDVDFETGRPRPIAAIGAICITEAAGGAARHG